MRIKTRSAPAVDQALNRPKQRSIRSHPTTLPMAASKLGIASCIPSILLASLVSPATGAQHLDPRPMAESALIAPIASEKPVIEQKGNNGDHPAGHGGHDNEESGQSQPRRGR